MTGVLRGIWDRCTGRILSDDRGRNGSNVAANQGCQWLTATTRGYEEAKKDATQSLEEA